LAGNELKIQLALLQHAYMQAKIPSKIHIRKITNFYQNFTTTGMTQQHEQKLSLFGMFVKL